MKRFCLVAPLTLAMAALCIGQAEGDGGFFPVYEGVANTADQRAVVVDHGDAETIVLQTAYDGDASEFAWVIPLPSLISAAQAVGTTDPALFDALDRVTSPRALTWQSSSAMCGCSGGDDGPQVQNGVTVWETLRVDDYDVALLSAEQSGDLAAWLATNGYGFPEGNEDTLQYYLDRESFFVALKVVPAGERDGNDGAGPPGDFGGDAPEAQELDPITVTFPTDEIVFPMRISRVSTRERVEVLLYVIADHRMKSANYNTAEVDAPDTWGGDDFAQAYNGWLEDTIADHGGKALVVEYAGRLPEYEADRQPLSDILDGSGPYFLTRMRTRLAPAQMEDDIQLVAAASDDRFEVVVGDGIAQLRGRLAFGCMLFAGVQAVVFRSRRGRRAAQAMGLLAIAIAIL